MLFALALAANAQDVVPDASIAAALAAAPPDLASCMEGFEGHFAGEAVLNVTLTSDGTVSKVVIDHTDAPFPEDCGLSVLRDVRFPPGAGDRTFDLTVAKAVDRSVVTYGPRVGAFRIEDATRDAVRACALAHPDATPGTMGAVAQYAFGPSGKAVSSAIVFGGFTGEGVSACIVDAYASAKLPKASRGGALIVWEPLRWTTDDVR